MELKHSLYADGVGWLYRSAFQLACGDKESAIEMFQKAEAEIGKKELVHLSDSLKKIKSISKKSEMKIVAEKILDEYQIRMFDLMKSF